MSSSQGSTTGGRSGMNMKSAPALTPAMSASQPQWRPMTSTTKARECEKAVELILSIDSHILRSAVYAPIVISVMDISLSIDPTVPTMLRCAYRSACSDEIVFDWRSSLTREGHSARKTSAPVSEPSPPQTTIESIPSVMRFFAADKRPSFVRNAAERAVPISVPPYAYSQHAVHVAATFAAPLRTTLARRPSRLG